MAEINWKVMDDGSMKFYALKQDLFAWAKENTFAQPDAKEPADFLYAVQSNIQDNAAQASLIDLEASKGDKLVYHALPAECAFSMPTLTAKGLARIVLGLK